MCSHRAVYRSRANHADTLCSVIERLCNKQVVVMGLGRFGGGAGVARWLVNQGARVLITDQQPAASLAASLHDLSDLIDTGAIELRLGEHRETDFAAAELIVVNPAVPHPWDNRYLAAAIEHRVPLTTEIRLLVERINRDRVIGVTGTAGKSTTAAMIHHILRAVGAPAHLGGNIGGSLLNTLHDISRDDWIILELSSAMLHWLGAGVGYASASGWSPGFAVLTNIQPNHIDWHGSFEHYRDCKDNIFRYQTDGDTPIRAREAPLHVPVPLVIPGSHNQRNAQVALTAVQQAIGLDPSEGAALLHDFTGLPHRLQLVHIAGGVRFYDDSKSTTPAATVLAVQAFDDPARIHLIAGGYDKKIDLSPIAELGSRIAGLYTIGAVGEALARAAQIHGSQHVALSRTLDQAVSDAATRMQQGDILLLSPGCASWDQFDNYQQRGQAFATLVGERGLRLEA